MRKCCQRNLVKNVIIMKCLFCDGKLHEVTRDEYFTFTFAATIEIIFECDKCKRTPSLHFENPDWYDENDNYIDI